jgi:hypothetical protein
MDRLRKQFGGFFGVTTTAVAAPPHPAHPHPAGSQTIDPRTTEHPSESADVAAGDTDSGIGPNSQAPTLRHDMPDQR